MVCIKMDYQHKYLHSYLQSVLNQKLKMISFTEIVTCNGSALYQNNKKQVSFHSSGTLSVLIAYDGMIMLKINNFQYGINSQDQILYDDKDPQFSLIFYLRRYPEGHWILKINENSDSVYSCLNQKCYLKNKRSGNVIRQYKREQAYSKVVEIQEQPRVQAVKKQSVKQLNGNYSQEGWTAKGVLIGASKGLNIGLGITGKYISKGLDNLGGFFAKKVQKSDKQINLSENTKQNLKFASKTTKNVLNFTSQQVANLFRFGKNVACDIGDRFEKSEKGKQMQQKQYYETVKQGAKTGVKVVGNLYDGVVTAVYEIGSGLSKGTTKVVSAKYGNDAGQAANEVFQGAGNICKVVRSPYDQAAKMAKQQDNPNKDLI